MDRAFVALFMIVVGIILWLILRAAGVFNAVNHDIAFSLGAIISYVSGLLGWRLVKIYQKRAKSKMIETHQINQD